MATIADVSTTNALTSAAVLVVPDDLVGCSRVLHRQGHVPGGQPAQSRHDVGPLLIADSGEPFAESDRDRLRQ